MKNPPVIRSEIEPAIEQLRFEEARQILRGIRFDKDYNLIANLEDYVKKWQRLLERVMEIEA